MMEKMTKIFGFFLTLTALAVCGESAFAACIDPGELVSTYGRDFVADGKTFSFVGMNIRGLCHYGYGSPLPYTHSSHIDENLAGAQAIGCKVIRVFAAVNNATHEQVVDRLEIVLNKMEPLGLKAIVCFTDVYGATRFHPQGDDSYYMMQPSGWTLLDDTWFAGGYTVNYLPFVQSAVTRLKNHNAVFAWELGNELTDIKNPSNIIAFASGMAQAIKSIDSNHMVTTGFISIDHTQIGEQQGYSLYADPNIDFMTVHSYNGDDHSANHAVHSRLVIPLILEEFGWDASYGNRASSTETQMNKWFSERAVRAFMNWGYQAQNYDIGDGDGIYGIDRYSHPDYNDMVTLFSGKATELAAASVIPSDRLAPEGNNVALSCTEWKADSVFSSAYGGDKAYDGIVSGASKWTSDGSAPPHWLALDLGQYRDLDGITVRMAGAAGEYATYNFKAYEIQSGESIDGPWSTEFDVSNPAQFSFVHSLFDEPKRIRFLRIHVTETGIDNYCRLPEVEVYETTPSHVNTFCSY